MDKIIMNTETVVSGAKTTVLEKASFWLLSILLILIPIFAIPSPLSDFIFGKMAFVTLLILVTVIIGLFYAIRAGKIHIPNWKVLIVVSIVPVVTIVSAMLSIYRPGSLIGVGSEFNTVHFIVLGFLLLSLVTFNFQSKQRILWSYLGIVGVFSLISIFHIVRFIFGVGALNFGGLFGSMVANTVGSWNDIGTYAGLAVILSFITVEFVDISKALKAAFYTALGLGLGLLLVTNYYVVTNVFGLNVPLTFLIGLVALFVFVYIISLNYRSTKKIPVASLIVLVFCIIMTIGSSPIATYINGKVGINQADVLDVRPTITGTYTVAKQLISTSGVVRTLFGVGPNQFSAAWGMFKPAGVNQTVFWNTDFNYGAGYVLTTLVTTGVLGFLAWLLFLIATFWAGVRSVFVGTKDKFSVYLIVSSLLASGYLWIIIFFSSPSITILTLAFFSTGLLGASLVREKMLKVKEYNWTTSQRKGFVSVLLLILVLILIIAWGFTWIQRYVASIEIRKASVVLKGPENIAESEALIISAIQRAPSYDPYLRTYSELKMLELQAVFKKAGKNELTEETRPILDRAIGAAESAANMNPVDYRNFIFLGQIYQTAGLLGVEKAGDAALSAYKQASNLIPSSPLPAYLAGYLYTLANDSPNAKAALEQALQRKPNFEEAQTLYSQIKGNPVAQSSVSKDIQTSSSPAQKTETKTATSTATSTKSKK